MHHWTLIFCRSEQCSVLSNIRQQKRLKSNYITPSRIPYIDYRYRSPQSLALAAWERFFYDVTDFSFVFNKLLYCSSVWSNTSKKNIKKLQLLQNFAARIVLGFRKYDHISDGLKSLGWLDINQKLKFNDCVMMYKCLNESAPAYLSQRFERRSQIHSRTTRNCNDLELSKCRLATGQRSFSFGGAKIWNELPKSIRDATSLNTFKKNLLNLFKET